MNEVITRVNDTPTVIGRALNSDSDNFTKFFAYNLKSSEQYNEVHQNIINNAFKNLENKKLNNYEKSENYNLINKSLDCIERKDKRNALLVLGGLAIMGGLAYIYLKT